MSRNTSRPLTEADLDSRANALAIVGRIPKAQAVEMVTAEGFGQIDTAVAAGLHGHDGIGCTESFLFDEMACAAPAPHEESPAKPGPLPRFWSWLTAARCHLGREEKRGHQ